MQSDRLLTPLKRRPSLRDLAKRLGVSHTTVNMALQADPRISDALRERICAFAEQEGYFPNDLAWGLRTGKTGLLGIVIPLVNSGFISSLLESAIRTFWEAGFFPMTLASRLDLAAEAEMLQSLARRRVEGVLLMPGREDSGEGHFAQLLKEHVPVVTVNNPVPKLDLPLVSSDDIMGGELVTKYLIQAGHRRIFHIGSPLDSPFADRRREIGYCNAMKEAGLEPRVIHFQERLGPVGADSGFLLELQELLENREYTAVFCFNDVIALEVYALCRKLKLRIPDDLSVVGYSNEGWHGGVHTLDFVTPPLTTVDQRAFQMGEIAASTLLKLIENRTPDAADLLLKPRLVERLSVRTI